MKSVASGDTEYIRIRPMSSPAARRTSSGPVHSSTYTAPVEEALAKIGVGIGLAALILTATTGLRGEMRAMRTEMRAEIQAVRTEARADREALRAEARADRETFERHIIRLAERQGILSGHVESIRNHLATTPGKPRP